MVHPVEIPTNETMTWLRGALERRPSRILEVGCGNGEVAAALVREGHDVVAVDANAECVGRTRALGVEARRARFPSFEPEPGEAPFDVLLFTRLMHHLEDLPEVYARAASLLKPRGLLLLEDFAWEEVDEKSATWLYGSLRFADAWDLVPEGDWDWDSPPLDAWRARHIEEGLHGATTMLEASAELFDVEATARAPYVYRWIALYMKHDPHGFAATRAVLETERELIRLGTVVPLGMRAVARLRNDR